MEIRRSQVKIEVSFTQEELKVVGLALVGRLKDTRDIQLAQELNFKLLEGRKRILEEQVLYVDNALARATNLAQEVEPGDGPAHGTSERLSEDSTDDGP